MKLFYNATFFTMKSEDDTLKAILVDDEGIIIDVYKEMPILPTDIEHIDLQESFVYPGFIDTHTHSFEGGLYSLAANLNEVRSLSELFEILSQTKPIDGKIFAFSLDEEQLAERRFPTNEELDEIYPHNPVMIRRIDGHSAVLNTYALKSIPWSEKISTVSNGLLRGRLNDEAANWFNHISEEWILRAYQEAAQRAIQTGHTTIHTMIGDGRKDPEHYTLIAENLHLFPIDFILYPQIFDVHKAVELGARRIGGCLLADGSFGSHTAALLQPYADEPENYGLLYHSDKFWLDFVTEAHNEDLQVAVHCIGDRAISQLVNTYYTVQKNVNKDLRHIIIHNELTNEDIISKMAAANITAAMQPMFDHLWAGEDGMYQRVLGEKRVQMTNRFKTLGKHNIKIGGGSDWYVTELNALKGIDAAINHHNPNERLSNFDAISIYTKDAAYLSHDENMIGTLEKGKFADMVSTNIDLLRPFDYKNIEITKVIKKGYILA